MSKEKASIINWIPSTSVIGGWFAVCDDPVVKQVKRPEFPKDRK